MLDDLKYIHERDKQDALGVAQKQWQQLQYNFSVDWQLDSPITSVVLAGMGGSALSAMIAQSWPQTSVPFDVVRRYTLPDYVNSKTLFIASSYSGNTEETLAALEQAKSRSCQIVILASGGKLVDIAEQENYPLYRLPSGLQPRMATFYSLNALLRVLRQANVLAEDPRDELGQIAPWLEKEAASWAVDVPTKNNIAKTIAQELVGKSIVVYGGPMLYPAAYKWKISFNESSKHIAWVNQLSEFNHNEMMGWTKQPVDKPYAVIDLRSNLEHPSIQKRFTVTETLLSGMRPQPIVVQAVGDSIIKQLLWAITLGDFVSLYLALLNNIDPTPVELIEKFKKILNQP